MVSMVDICVLTVCKSVKVSLGTAVKPCIKGGYMHILVMGMCAIDI